MTWPDTKMRLVCSSPALTFLHILKMVSMFPPFCQHELYQPATTSKMWWILAWQLQDPQMHLFGFHWIMHIHVPQMVSDMTFSCTGRFFVLPVLAFVICNLGGVAAALAGKGWSKKVTAYLSFLHNPGNQVSHFFQERVHIFSSLPFITKVPTEGCVVALDVPGQI